MSISLLNDGTFLADPHVARLVIYCPSSCCDSCDSRDRGPHHLSHVSRWCHDCGSPPTINLLSPPPPLRLSVRQAGLETTCVKVLNSL